MEVMDQCEIFLWPIINGMEYGLSYSIQLVDSWKDRDDEPAGEVWEMIDYTAILVQYTGPVQLWVPDNYVEDLCEKHFAKKF